MYLDIRFAVVGMLKIKNLNYATSKTILFQRLSVIVTDFVFAYGAWLCTKNMHNIKSIQARGPSRDAAVFFLLIGRHMSILFWIQSVMTVLLSSYAFEILQKSNANIRGFKKNTPSVKERNV